jgi:UDP:flavonoid glycosyltransferase YjiC (YdhE family)
MPRALLAWEGGAGRGHVVTLKTVAEAVGDGFSFDAALCATTHKAELAGLCDAVVQGPWLPYSDSYRKAQGNPPASTWGEFMGDIGFRKPAQLRKSIHWWQQVMRDRNISLVIADFAPCALLAARGLGIASIAVGVGYSVPPPDMESFPVLLPRFSTRIYQEAEIVELVNSVVADFGVPKLDRLPQVYASSDQFAFTLDMLDPYADKRSAPLLPPVADVATELASDGDEVFIYFSTTEKSDPGLMEAIGSLGVPVRLFMPSLDAATAEHFMRRGIHVEQSPVPVDLLAKRTRLMVNAAQHGILCLALAAGLPQVSVPQHLEQTYHAEATASRGVLRSVSRAERDVESFKSIVLGAYEDRSLGQRARELARELRPHFQANQRKLIRRRIAAVMDYRV